MDGVTGSVDGDGPDTFAQVIALEVGRDGRIYVLDRQLNALRIFDPDGSHRRTVGRTGRGPAEYVAANGLAWLGDDTLVVVDGRGARYSLLDVDGIFARSVSRPLGSFGWVMRGGMSNGLLYEDAGYTSGDAWVPAFMGVVLGDSATVRHTIPAP